MNNWVNVTIKDLVKQGVIYPPMDGNHGETHPKGDDFQEDGIPFVMSSDINQGTIKFDKCKYISIEQASILRKGFSKTGDVLLTHKASIGRTAIVPEIETEYIMLTPQVTYYRVKNKDVLNNVFLKYYFDFGSFQELLALWAGSGSTRAYLGITAQQNLSIRLPKINEQKKIAKVLSDLDVKIEINNKMNAELEAMAKTIYDYWFVQFDFPNKNGKPYKTSGGKMVFNEELKREIPEGWEVNEINQVIEVKDGTHDSPKPVESGCKLITSKHLKAEGLDFEKANSISEEDYININKRSKVHTGDILFSMIGNIGTVYKIEEKNIDFAIKNVALYKTSSQLDIKNYVYMYLRGYDMQRYMGNVIAGSIQKFIGLGSLRKMPFMNDSNTIQRFEEKTKAIFEEMNILKTQNQKLAELRDWLLPMLMNGQVSVEEIKIKNNA